MKKTKTDYEVMLPGARLWTGDLEVEGEAIEQIRNVMQLPILAGPVAVMPDVHLGRGATVGTVIPTRAAIVPAAVGVDIGCGMLAVQTNLSAGDLPHNLGKVRAQIERDVPVGFDYHNQVVEPEGTAGAVKLDRRMKDLAERYPKLRILEALGGFNEKRLWRQLGSLGGGNHFVEICLDAHGAVWIMLHSGSRGIGNAIGTTAMEVAKKVADKVDRTLPHRDLAWLDEGTPEFEAYVEGLGWAQEYASLNRDLMLHLVHKALEKALDRKVEFLGEVTNCHHNYARVEEHFGENVWVTRKGAVSAQLGELGIIPGSMGARSFIVRGKGEKSSYCSCSHGAGRRMSRTAARKRFTREDLVAQTAGVECRKDGGVIDEIPSAYKDIDAVMAAQSDLVEIVATLKQILCVKG
ncbi:RtcB family protein [Usitatibacter palustris]|uniref:3'-phosphate/5'-hydroxy nucleic acid ligase n=1 Tax=Usitatibacter palustris TaxID=2732487 RepID=A0A6M4H892_9PROT|nr:RtcB family protein [Usitatibacter palustris]QJR15909.1 RNA-splicing ligase RtcB [Usitatibacter palustris]